MFGRKENVTRERYITVTSIYIDPAIVQRYRELQRLLEGNGNEASDTELGVPSGTLLILVVHTKVCGILHPAFIISSNRKQKKINAQNGAIFPLFDPIRPFQRLRCDDSVAFEAHF